MKKLTSILLVMIMLLPFLHVKEAEAEEYNSEAGLLKALNIIDKEYIPEAPITKYEATLTAMKLIGKTSEEYTYGGEFSDIAIDEPGAALVLEAVRSRIVSCADGTLFAKNSNITYEEAIRLIFDALSFSIFAGEGQNTYYMRLAREYKLDIKINNRKEVTAAEFYGMAARALEIPLVALRGIKNGSTVHETDKDSNALEQYFDVYKTKGYIESDGITSLYSKKDCTKGMLRINGLEINCPELPEVYSLLGMGVELYYKDRDNPQYVYHKGLTGQKILKIGSDDIRTFTDNTYFYEDSSGSGRRAGITDDCAIIYNGKAVTEEDSSYISNDLFIPENGYVELLSDRSGSYAVVKIYSFDTYVVQNVYSDEEKMIIVDKYGLRNLCIDSDACLIVRDKNHGELTFDSIETGDVLSVASSYDCKYVLIYACGDAVEGIFTACAEDTVTIEGEDFTLSKQLRKNKNRIPKIGENVVVYMDGFDRAVAIEMHPESLWNTGLLLKAGTKGKSFWKRAGCRILTSESNVETLYAAQKILIDGKKYTESDDLAAVLKPNEVIRYKLNKEGELFKIDTAQKVEGNNTLQSAGTGSYTWRNTHSLLYSSEGDIIPVKGDAAVFVNPEFVTFSESGGKAENADFYDKDYFTSGTGFLTNGIVYNIKAYKTNADSMLADVILCGFYNYDLYMRTEQTYVVKKVLAASDEDGNELIKIKCSGISGEKEMWDYRDRTDNVYVNSSRTLKDIKRGDIVRADLANDGRILFLFKIFDYSGREFYQRICSGNAANVETSETLPKYIGSRPGEYNNYSDREYYVYGDAMEFSDGYIRVKPCGGTRDIIFKSSDNVIIFERNDVRRGTMNDVCFDKSGACSDKIFIASYLSGIQTAVVFK